MRQGTGSLFDPNVLPAGALTATGLEGVRTFAQDIAAWPEIFDDGTLTASVRAIPVFVEKAGTGGGLFRRLQAGFCAEVARLTGDAGFHDAAIAYRHCADAWSHLANQTRLEAPDPAGIADAAARLPDAEENAVRGLEKVASKPS